MQNNMRSVGYVAVLLLLSAGIAASQLWNISSAQAKEAQAETATVPGWQWIDVMNADKPVSSGNSSFGFGDTCGIKRDGVVKIVAADGDRLLVSYSIKGLQHGTACPSGVMFFLARVSFNSMTAKHQKAVSEEKALKDLVRSLAAQ